MNNSRLENIYMNMKRRCYNPQHHNYERYGGRGITICDEWLNPERDFTIGGHPTKGFISFRTWALENGYADNLTIDRIDNNKGYSPINCRWVSIKVQNNNRSCCTAITYHGKTQNLTQWCEELGLNYRLVQMRLRRNWSVEKAFEEKKHLNGWY